MDDHDQDGGAGAGVREGLPRVLGRRRALQVLGLAGVAGAAALAGCGSGDDAPAGSDGSDGSTSPTSTSSSGGGDQGDEIPEETAGPFPGDGSNGPDVLAEDGVVRQDIRSSFGSASGVAEGVPLSIALTVLDAGSGEPLPGAAVYVWHCDRDGGYSLYSPGVEGENYLRGVQEADEQGRLSFTSVFPGAYAGRWPHVHFEVYESVDAATGGGSPTDTSQLALPEDVCSEVYATDGYEQSVENMAGTSLDGDMVFADDGAEHQLATVSGDVASGLTAQLDVPV